MTQTFAPPELADIAQSPPVVAQPSVVLATPEVPRPHRGRRLLIAIGLSGLIVGGLYGLHAARGVSSVSSSAALQSAAPANGIRPATPGSSATSTQPLDVAKVVATIGPSVVKVAVDIHSAQGDGEGVGTGIILTADGNIVTNNHVVADATKVRVLLNGESEPRTATVLGTDPGNDLALIHIDAKNLPVAQLAPENSVRIGDPVMAMGFALDLPGEASVTAGIVSALNRTMLTENGALNGLIQTDAAISSGNSGGPLVDSSGRVVGINSAVARSTATSAANNVGFSISASEIRRVVAQLSSGGGKARVEGYLGVGVSDRHDGGRGAIVTEVQVGSPAAKVGLHVGRRCQRRSRSNYRWPSGADRRNPR